MPLIFPENIKTPVTPFGEHDAGNIEPRHPAARNEPLKMF